MKKIYHLNIVTQCHMEMSHVSPKSCSSQANTTLWLRCTTFCWDEPKISGMAKCFPAKKDNNCKTIIGMAKRQKFWNNYWHGKKKNIFVNLKRAPSFISTHITNHFRFLFHIMLSKLVPLFDALKTYNNSCVDYEPLYWVSMKNRCVFVELTV